MTARKFAILLAHALAGWALCAATMGIGMRVTSLGNALILHAVAAPLFFGVVAWNYFSRFAYTAPLQTALLFRRLRDGHRFLCRGAGHQSQPGNVCQPARHVDALWADFSLHVPGGPEGQEILMDSETLQFAHLYADFQPRIVRYLRRLVGEFEAEDLAQEVFAKVQQALPGFRGEASLSTWVYRIATHAAYDRWRSPAFRCTHPFSLCDDQVENVADCDPWNGDRALLVEQRFVKQEMSACLQKYIAALPETYGVVLVLSDLEGFSNAEIAEVIGITLATVKIRLHRARARLREALESHCEYYWTSELGWKAT